MATLLSLARPVQTHQVFLHVSRTLFTGPRLLSSFPISHRSILIFDRNIAGRNRLFSSPKSTNTNKHVADKGPTAASEAPSSSGPETMTAWQRFLAPKPMPERKTAAWYREMILICTVFAVTGSSTMWLVRPAVSNGLGIRGSLKDGPWSYRICSLVIMTPIYATLLVVVGTLFGRHAYFRHFSVKIFSRFGIPPEVLDPTFHQTKKTFRKW